LLFQLSHSSLWAAVSCCYGSPSGIAQKDAIGRVAERENEKPSSVSLREFQSVSAPLDETGATATESGCPWCSSNSTLAARINVAAEPQMTGTPDRNASEPMVARDFDAGGSLRIAIQLSS